MALIKCPECGKEISDKAKACPNCGLDIIEYNQKLEEERIEAERQKRIEDEQRKEAEQKKLKELESKDKCPECGLLVDKGVEKCPNCGFPLKEEKERIKVELDNEKRKNKKFIIIGMSFIVLLCICSPIINSYIKSSKYDKAIGLLKNGDLYEAKQIFGQLHEYKDSKKMLEAIDVGTEMLPVIKASNTDDFWFSGDIYIQALGDILEESEKYEVLNNFREKMVNNIKIMLDYPLSNRYKDYYEDVEYLIDCIDDYTDTKELTSKLKNLQVVELLKYVDENENYEEVAKAISELDIKNEEFHYLYDLYMELYDKYGEFLGKYYTFEFKIAYDWTNLYKNEDDIYFGIINSGVHLDNQEKDGDTGCCYSNLVTEDNRMSFLYHNSGSGSEDNSVVLEVVNGTIQMIINGKEIRLDSISESKKNDDLNKKRVPQIGDTANDVKLSSWGTPNKINKTTTTNGVREQWVYGGGKYIYLDDGIVTAIQE